MTSVVTAGTCFISYLHCPLCHFINAVYTISCLFHWHYVIIIDVDCSENCFLSHAADTDETEVLDRALGRMQHLRRCLN